MIDNRSNATEQDAWLGKIQNELGVLYSNYWLLEIQKEKLTHRVLADAELIAHLKERILKLEQANTELRESIQPERENRNVKNTNKPRSTRS